VSGFGPLVIGEKQWKKEQDEEAKGTSAFGPAVLGEPGDDKPGITNEPGPDNPLVEETQAPKPAPKEKESFSVRAVREALADDPVHATIDRMTRAEMFRPEGPRKSALTEILRAEKRRPDPRPEVTEMLTDAIQELE